MINEQTLKIYEEIKKEHSEAKEQYENSENTFFTTLQNKGLEIKNLFLNAIKEISIDKIDIIDVEKNKCKTLLIKILIPTENKNIEYAYVKYYHYEFNNLGLHYKMDNIDNKYYSLDRLMTEKEQEIIYNFIEILLDYTEKNSEIIFFRTHTKDYIEKTKQIQGGYNANNNTK